MGRTRPSSRIKTYIGSLEEVNDNSLRFEVIEKKPLHENEISNVEKISMLRYFNLCFFDDQIDFLPEETRTSCLHDFPLLFEFEIKESTSSFPITQQVNGISFLVSINGNSKQRNQYRSVRKIISYKKIEKSYARTFMGDISEKFKKTDFHDFANSNKDKNPSSLYCYKVFDCGQALATSLICEKEKLFYFDLGLPNPLNRHTLPKKHVRFSFSNDTFVVISHLHFDHYSGGFIGSKALKRDWFIPSGVSIPPLFMTLAAQIIKNGHMIYMISSPFICFSNRVTFSTPPITFPRSTNIHETGLILTISEKYSTSSLEVITFGDQSYDYIAGPTLAMNSKVLVATHHGGTYGTGSTFPKFPRFSDVLVLSYGNGNIYGHPSELPTYASKGFRNIFCTPVSGDFKIFFK